MTDEFPVGDTLAQGTFRVTERLLRGTSQHLYLGVRAEDPNERYFASIMWAAKPLPADLHQKLDYRVPGIYDLVGLDRFDVTSNDESRRIEQSQHCALVERLPGGEGEWLPGRTTEPLGPRGAVGLGLSVGQILQRAVKGGIVLWGVRPESIWVRRHGGEIVATGLSARNAEFFSNVQGGCMIPAILYTKFYMAPEVYSGSVDREESLVFTLAVMIAEWATGQHPFSNSLVHRGQVSLAEGRHLPLDVPPALEKLLKLALKPLPEHRPTLAHFLKRLSVLTPAELTPALPGAIVRS